MTDEERTKARERVVTAIERSAAEYGLPRSAGRLYGILYFAEGPLSLDALAERSGYAKSTVSDTLGLLENVYLVRKASPPSGGRRSYYEAERDLWYAFYRVVQESGRREVQLMTRALEDAEERLAAADDPGTDLQRVRDLKAEYEDAALLLDLLESVPPETLREILLRAAWLADAGDSPASLDVEGLGDRFDLPGFEPEFDPDDIGTEIDSAGRGSGQDAPDEPDGGA